ncbi:MAG: MerR family transcriptional regulator [Anaerolineae bacterium]
MRIYERKRLISPARSQGSRRHYFLDDLRTVQLIRKPLRRGSREKCMAHRPRNGHRGGR